MIGATDSTSILSICFSGGSGSVLVTHDPADRRVLQPVDGRAGQHAVGGHRPHLGGAALACRMLGGRARCVPPVSIMSSMSTQCRPSTSPMTSRGLGRRWPCPSGGACR